MIYISQGHEKSIGLEILFKSLLHLSDNEISQLLLVANKKSVIETLNTLNIKSSTSNEFILIENKVLKTAFLEPDQNLLPQSTQMLEHILKNLITDNDILFTLPTSKDQLILNKKNKAGYTEYLRSFYHNPNLAMNFHSDNERLLLITDHIPLSQVSKKITKEIILNKIKSTLDGNLKYFWPIKKILIAGINPHAGEGGILGHEEKLITQAISILKNQYPQIDFEGPLSADALHMYCNNDEISCTLKVFMYHDQGLVYFKSKNGIIGSNLTFGLPFLRLSVDHGTAFSLFGKNCADYNGALFSLKQALNSQV